MQCFHKRLGHLYLLRQCKTSVVSPTFEHSYAYQDDPCGSQGPKHTQQKSDLQDWFLHTI